MLDPCLLKVCQAHPAIGPVHQTNVLSRLVPIAFLDRVFEELETVAKDSRLHAPVRSEIVPAKEDSDLEPVCPIVPYRDEMLGMLLVPAQGRGEHFASKDIHLFEDLLRRRVVCETADDAECHQASQRDPAKNRCGEVRIEPGSFVLTKARLALEPVLDTEEAVQGLQKQTDRCHRGEHDQAHLFEWLEIFLELGKHDPGQVTRTVPERLAVDIEGVSVAGRLDPAGKQRVLHGVSQAENDEEERRDPAQAADQSMIANDPGNQPMIDACSEGQQDEGSETRADGPQGKGIHALPFLLALEYTISSKRDSMRSLLGGIGRSRRDGLGHCSACPLAVPAGIGTLPHLRVVMP